MVEGFIGHHSDREAEVLEWVRSNTTNEYILPWNILKEDWSFSYWRAFHNWQSDVIHARMTQFEKRRIEKATEQLPHCVARGDIEAVKSMLAKGADVDAVVAEYGPLEAIARANGRGKMVEYLEAQAKP